MSELMKGTKAEIRQLVLSQRQALDAGECDRLSDRITGRLASIPGLNGGGPVAVYYPIRNEVNIIPFVEQLLDSGQPVLFPATFPQARMEFRRITSWLDLAPARFGLREPGPDCPVWDPQDITAMIIPGVAFDFAGYRLGYGGGYYDRYLPGLAPTALRIAVAYDFQLIAELPHDKHDQRMGWIVTDQRVSACGDGHAPK